MADREFAVLIPIFDHGASGGRSPSVLLTKRPEDLARYSGQVCLPGGAREAGDVDLVATALRETTEEVGIPACGIEIIDELDWFETLSGDRVKPFAGRVRADYEIRPSPREVERVLYIDIAFLRQDPFEIRGTLPTRPDEPIYTFDCDGLEIWGLTARILRHYFVEREAQGKKTKS